MGTTGHGSEIRFQQATRPPLPLQMPLDVEELLQALWIPANFVPRVYLP